MRVIREGVLPNWTKSFRGECGNCGCIIECSEEELSRVTGSPKRPCATLGCDFNIELKEVVHTKTKKEKSV